MFPLPVALVNESLHWVNPLHSGYPAAFSAFVTQPPKQSDILQDLFCGQLGEMFTGNILYQHLVMDPKRCWQRFTLGSRLLSTHGQGFSFAPKSETEDHFLVSEVGDWHRYTTSPHRLDQMSISPPLSGNKKILPRNEELPIVEWVECRRKLLTCDLGMCGFGPPSARHLVKCVGMHCHWWIQILPWVYVSGFFLAGVSVLNLCIYPKLASGAMCMEVSSVFLSTYLGDMEIPRKSHEFKRRCMDTFFISGWDLIFTWNSWVGFARHLMFRQIDGKLCAILSDVAAAFFVPGLQIRQPFYEVQDKVIRRHCRYCSLVGSPF